MNGKDFKINYGTKFFKFLNNTNTHNNFKYKIGLNVDVVPFNPNGNCETGGLYFTDINNIFYFYDYGNKIACIKILDDSRVYIENFSKNGIVKFKTDKFIITEIYETEDEIMKLLEYADNMKYKWEQDNNLCTFTAKCGYINCLKYVHNKGCKITDYTRLIATMYGTYDTYEHTECLKYINDILKEYLF